MSMQIADANAKLLAAAHSASKVVQCGCGRISKWRAIADLTIAGWRFRARGLPVRLHWTCPDCAGDS